ncbi:MAG TPA: hypothetical protein VNX46_06385, partial [Candidatus Acidoferrum sp.]|nr:hypothetical protein [Candidatus Acidoferrum sp.]
DLEQSIPQFKAMLQDTDQGVRASGLEMLQRLGQWIPRSDLLGFLTSPDPKAISLAYSQLTQQHESLSGDEALVLLQSTQPVARLLGLRALDQNPGKESVQLALPLLRDPDEMVRLKTAQTLRAQTGQEFSEDDADGWTKWWLNHRTNFTAQVNTEQGREIRELPDTQAYHSRGCDNYDARRFADALADFREACARAAEVDDYSRFRIWLIRARSGERESATKELAGYLNQRKAQSPPDWALKVGRFLTGQMTEADFLMAANNANAQTDREQHCEAYFYAASIQLFDSNLAGAADLFKKCVETKVTDFEEYDSARAELKYLP